MSRFRTSLALCATLAALCPQMIAAPPAASASTSVRPFVLEAGEGETRDRRPRPWLPIPTSSFTFKIDSTNGPSNFFFATETLQPGAAIPYHRHLHEDEMLYIGSGVAHVHVGALERDAHAGAIVFIPRNTWITLRNSGKIPIALLFAFDAENFENYLRCTSAPHGTKAPPMTPKEFAVCTNRGDVEYKK